MCADEVVGSKRRRYPTTTTLYTQPPQGSSEKLADGASSVCSDGSLKNKKRFVWPDDLHR